MRKRFEQDTELPKGVSASFDGHSLSVRGPLGEWKKDFSRIGAKVVCEKDRLRVEPLGERKAHISMANTAQSIIRNAITGVTKGFTYRLKVVFAHFPISVKVKGEQVIIENFYGERTHRIAKIVGDCKVSVEGDDVVVKGVSLEDVGQTAANIERATRVTRKDQRIFLDGIYVYEKKRG